MNKTIMLNRIQHNAFFDYLKSLKILDTFLVVFVCSLISFAIYLYSLMFNPDHWVEIKSVPISEDIVVTLNCPTKEYKEKLAVFNITESCRIHSK